MFSARTVLDRELDDIAALEVEQMKDVIIGTAGHVDHGKDMTD